MKKLILASAFALMATPALFAQSDNSFSMQIELKNGTKITLGPNDLKNISFVDGAIKIEGNTIEDLRMAIEKAEANTKNMVAEQRYDLNDLKKEAAELQAMIDYLSDKVAKLENAGGGSGNTEDITALQAAIAMLQSELAKVQSSEMATKTDVAATNEKINNIQAMVKVTEAAIMDLQEAVKGLSSGSSGSGSVGNEERIKLLEEAVNNLKADMNNLSSIEQIKKLQAQIDDLMAMVNAVATNSSADKAMIKELESKMTAVEAAMVNLMTSSMNSQEQIDKLTVESNNVQDDLDATKEEFRANIQTLSAALAKTSTFAENEVANIRRNLDDMIEKVASINTAVDYAEKDRAAIYAAIKAVNNDSQALAANFGNLENKIETLDGYTKSWVPSIQERIDKEIADRGASINTLEEKIKNLPDLETKIYQIILFLNANIFHSNYGENAFNKWLERQ